MDPDYELFVQVAESGSLSAGGRVLGLSPAMVSKRLARLEARLGVQLIHRTTRRLALTAPGDLFYRDAVSILTMIAEAEARVTGQAGVLSGVLRVSAPTSFGRLHLAPHLKPFLDAHPHLTLELDLSDAFVDLLSERIDVAIRIGADVGHGLTAKRLSTSRRVLCASPDYLARSGAPRTIAELKQHRLLAASGQFPWTLIGRRGAVTVDEVSHVRTNSSEVVRELALAGVGIALRSLWDVGHDLSEGRLTRVLRDYRGSSETGIYAVTPNTTLRPHSVTSFIDFLAHLYGEPAPWELGRGRMVSAASRRRG